MFQPNLSANLSFRFCNSVAFKTLERPFLFMQRKEKLAAATPGDWFRFLQDAGCQKLRLHYSPSKGHTVAKDYKLAGFIGGGGTWVMEAVYLNYSEAWAGKWEVTRQDDPDNKPWAVTYMRIPGEFRTQDFQVPLQQAKEALENALAGIEAFAAKHDFESFRKMFAKAGRALASEAPENFYFNPQLIPNEYFPLSARQNLYAAGTAWVFGGMGSWNNLGFDTETDNNTYETLSENLYNCVNQSILAAVNAY